MPRTKGATDKSKRKSKLGRNLAIIGTALVTSGGIYGKNVSNKVKLVKGLEEMEVQKAISNVVKASKLGLPTDKLLSESTEKAAKYAQNTNLLRAKNIIKDDVKKIGSSILSKIIRRGK